MLGGSTSRNPKSDRCNFMIHCIWGVEIQGFLQEQAMDQIDFEVITGEEEGV